MSRITHKFQQRGSKRALLIPFLNAGDPSKDISLRAFESVIESGADIVEIGVPYSDPLADGPVIQASALRSLESGFSLPVAFEVAAHLRQKTDAALVLFSYVNPLIQYGIERFYADAKAAGVDGTIVPDLPYEESEEFLRVADRQEIDLIPLLAPTSGDQRIERIAQNARGFIYCVSSLGVTGERARMSDRLRDMVASVRSHTSLPVGVGFGVSGPAQAKEIASFADGVIVGSAYVRRIEQAVHNTTDSGLADAVQSTIAQFTRELVEAID